MYYNYIGGFVEYILNVMYLVVIFCEWYECRRIEIIIFVVKLYDIGNIYELYYNGLFKYIFRGEMEGYIVIGVEMLDEVIRKNLLFYFEDFVIWIKGCIV